MNDLVKVDFDTQTVSARELHEQLHIKTAFKDWFPRMCEYGFEEGKDFCSKMSETSSKGGRPSKDADITIDMAREHEVLTYKSMILVIGILALATAFVIMCRISIM